MKYLSDSEIIKKYNLQPKEKVLDIGGSMKQHELIKVDTLVDIFHPEEVPYYPTKLKANRFVKVDITREKLPFSNNEFDFVICSHTLEDLHNPFLIMDEMQRVAKRGLIITPSRGQDMVFDKFNLSNWQTGGRRIPGMAHHKWFFEKSKEKIIVTVKNYPLLYTREFHITDWKGDIEMVFYWENGFDYEVEYGIDMHGLISNYRKFTAKHKKLLDKSLVLFFIDYPANIAKEWLKLLLHSGLKA